MTSSSDATDHPKPAVEPSPATADSTTRALQQRIRQQEILAELGVVALQGKPFLELLSETVRLTAEGMNAEFCKVLEFNSGGQSSPGARRCRLARRHRRKSDGGHLRQIIRDLEPTVAPSKIQFDATEAIRFCGGSCDSCWAHHQ